MNKWIKKTIIACSSLFFLFAVVGVPQIAHANAEDVTTDGSPLKADIGKQNSALGSQEGAGYGEPSDLRLIVAEIVRIFLTFLGTLFAIYTFYGGYIWMTAGGNEDQVSKAQSVIVHGAIGIFVIFFSYSLAYFVYKTMFYAQQTEYITFFRWGTIPKGYQGFEGQGDPLQGHRDPLEQEIPTPDFDITTWNPYE